AVMLRTNAMVRALHAETAAWWGREVLGPGGPGGPGGPAARPIDRLVDAGDRFGRAMHEHIRGRFLVQSAQATLIRIATRAGAPQLGRAVMAGQGDVAETEMADDVWRIAHGQLDEATFLSRYGFHGPHEGHPCSRSRPAATGRVRP